MKTKYTVAFSMLAGVAIGVVAVQGLQAQGKPKAYTVSELESLDPTAQAAFTPLAQAAMKAAGGRTLNTGGGRVVEIDGPPPPKRVVINEWDSLDQATAYYKSKAWNDLAPQRDKAIKTIRRYAVEFGELDDIRNSTSPNGAASLGGLVLVIRAIRTRPRGKIGNGCGRWVTGSTRTAIPRTATSRRAKPRWQRSPRAGDGADQNIS